MSADADLAAELARGAGELLLQIRAEANADGRGGRDLSRRGDFAANEYLLKRLRSERPDDAVLSEESADDRARLERARVWIVDPLDGSKEFGTTGRDDWAVHVALWERGEGITAAAVALPGLSVVHSSADEVQEAMPRAGVPKIVVSGSRPPKFVDAVAAELGAEIVTMGSAGAKAMAVLRGDVDAYVHAGGQWEWDSAAPVGVCAAAGLHCSRIDGTELRYNEAHPYLPDLVISRSAIAEPLLAAIGKHTEGSTDSARVAMAREYIASLSTHDATKVRLAADAWRIENGRRTGESRTQILEDLEHGEQYTPIQGIRALKFREWGDNVVARYDLDFGAPPAPGITVHVTEYFDVPGGEIASIMAIIEPESTKGDM